MSKRKISEATCVDCGNVFVPVDDEDMYCPECEPLDDEADVEEGEFWDGYADE